MWKSNSEKATEIVALFKFNVFYFLLMENLKMNYYKIKFTVGLKYKNVKS